MTLSFFEVHPALRDGDLWSREIMANWALDILPKDYWLLNNRLDSSKPTHASITELLNRTWLRSNCLALADRMSMANSVEMRLPLLDNLLVNRMIGMRNKGLEDWKMPHKSLLVKALRDTLPSNVLKRKKQGFTPPVQKWMRSIIENYQNYPGGGYLVNNGLIDYNKYDQNQNKFDMFFVYKLVLLECWCRLHLGGQTIQELASSKSIRAS